MYTQLASRVDITPTAGSEQTVDLSANIPVGATGVTLYLKNSSPNGQLCGGCHPNLTLRLGNIRNRSSTFLSVGVNGSRQIKVQIATSSITVYLVGYFDSDCTFLNDDLDAVDVTPTNNTWEKVDHSSLSTSAIFAIYNISRTGDVDIGTYASSIGTVAGTDPAVTAWPASLCGTDFVPMADLGSSQYGTWLYRNGFYTVHLVGFVNAGAEVIGPTDVSTTNLNTYEAINDASDAIMIQYRGAYTAEATVNETYLSSDSAGAESMGGRPSGINSAIVATDGSSNIYQYIENVDQDYFVIGSVTNAAAGLTISTVTDPIVSGSNFTITGTNFEASQGTGSVTVGGQTASIVSWSDTSITASIGIESTSAKYGANDVVVTNNSAESDTQAAHTVNPESGNSFVNIGTPATAGDRITATADLATGDQVRYGNVLYQGGSPTAYTVSVADTGIFTVSGGPVPDGTYTFAVNAWDSGDQTWGTEANQTVVFGDVVSISEDAPANEILAAIVTQLGGTVTDPNNRNSLLNDWLNALP